MSRKRPPEETEEPGWMGETFFPRKMIQDTLGDQAEEEGKDSTLVTLKSNLLETIGTMSSMWMEQQLLRPLLVRKRAMKKSSRANASTGEAASQIITLQDVLDVIQNGDCEGNSSSERDPILSSLLKPPYGALHVHLEEGMTSKQKISSGKPKASSQKRKPKAIMSSKSKGQPRKGTYQDTEGENAEQMAEEDIPSRPKELETVVEDNEDYD